jgi:hypothetical protein
MFNQEAMRSILRTRFLSVFIPAACLASVMILAARPSFAQQTQPAPSGSQQTTQTPPALPPPSKEPDYPDRRTLFFGAIGFAGVSSSNSPDIRGGAIAPSYESLYGLGKVYKISPGVSAGIPITRTGMLYLDLERYHGQGAQTISRDTTVDTFLFSAGDVINSGYHVVTGRIYLDDLLYPHKFPVARLRFRSIWGLRILNIIQTVDSPTEDTASGAPGGSQNGGSAYIYSPEFGLAMEYALARHVLFRVDGAGFTFPHRADLAETSATLSLRDKHVELLGGVKTLHFKTSPKKEEYETGTFITPYVELRWHW